MIGRGIERRATQLHLRCETIPGLFECGQSLDVACQALADTGARCIGHRAFGEQGREQLTQLPEPGQVIPGAIDHTRVERLAPLTGPTECFC